YESALASVFTALFEAVAADQDDAAAARLHDFIVDDYLPAVARAPWRDAWQVLFARLDDGQTAALEALGMSSLVATPLVEHGERWAALADAHEDELEALRERPLSVWDQAQVAHYQGGNPEVSPLDFLSLYLRTSRFRTVWSTAIDGISPSDLACLDRWGAVIATTQTRIPVESARLPLEQWS
nr:hypothetical protein [Deltaproteobacteria bacterium]